MQSIFKHTAGLISKLDSLLDDISRAALLFRSALDAYLDGNRETFCEQLERVGKLESEVDDQRREIRHELYTRMLIPESRGDVLSLLENIDNVIDLTKDVLQDFRIESPAVPAALVPDFKRLAEASSLAMDQTVLASRAFFTEVHLIGDYINKTFFYEHEADIIELQIKERIFADDTLDLSGKLQLRDFTIHIASVSDAAESVCERLSVAAIKRTI